MPAKKSTAAAKATRSNVSKVVEGGKGRATSKAAASKAKVAANAEKVTNINARSEKAQKEAEKAVADAFLAAPKGAASAPKDGPVVHEGKVERLRAASEEAKAAKEAGWKWNKQAKTWEKMDPEEKTTKPPTPNLDLVNAGDAGKTPGEAKKASGNKRAAKKDRQPLFFLVDGEPVNPAFNNLAGISRVTGRKGGKRLSTAELRKLLVKEGIADPDDSVWTFKLPNGVTLKTTRTEPKAKAKRAS